MFKFGFRKNDEAEDNIQDVDNTLNWTPASEIPVSLSILDTIDSNSDLMEFKEFPSLKINLVRSDKVLTKLKDDHSSSIIEAESQHSDLIPAIYEGGLKIWECTYDLGNYILSNNIDLTNKLVLDLGCGYGIIGLIAYLRASSVHFQDYNSAVIESVTIPNILLNSIGGDDVLRKCKFFCGDWKSFIERFLSNDNTQKYDVIFTCETIYNPDNQIKLYEVFKQGLKYNGIGYSKHDYPIEYPNHIVKEQGGRNSTTRVIIKVIGGVERMYLFNHLNDDNKKEFSFVAAKIHYFGVGGGMRQFENLVREDGLFETSIVWKSSGGLQREILRLQRR